MTIQTEKSETSQDEQLSSFLDGELTEDQCETFIGRLCKDEGMKACLARYQLISDTMRNQLPVSMKPDFVQSVISAIESEPTVLAPSPSRSNFTSNISKKAAGFAIAASVATLAVIGVQSQYMEDEQQVASMPESNEFVRLTNDRPVTASAQPMVIPKSSDGFSNASTVVDQQTVNQRALPQIDSLGKLDAELLHQYIINHSQYASGASVNEIISHARIVASTKQQNSVDQVQR